MGRAEPADSIIARYATRPLDFEPRSRWSYSNTGFLIIGRGTMADILRSDIVRLGLTAEASLTPYATDMPRAMNAIDCLVHPQIGTEALGLVVCEAFACGKPVIASALDGIPEAFAVGGCGELVPPEKVPALAAAMLERARLPLPNEAERMRLHCRVAEQVSLEKHARSIERLYRQLLEAKPKAAPG